MPKWWKDSTLAERRRLLVGLAGTAATFGMWQQARTQAQPDVSLSVGYESAGTPIPPDFIGLSYESALLASSDYFTPRNASVFGLLRALGPNGAIRLSAVSRGVPQISGDTCLGLWIVGWKSLRL